MKITIWGINYAPEPTGIGPYNTDLCSYLHESGHQVRMVTAFPYYPEWRKRAADRLRFFRREAFDGVEVLRCWQYVPSRPNAWRRMVHEASFICSSFLRVVFTPRPDLFIVVSPPLFLGPAAWLAGLIKRCPFHFHVQDMQPDAAVSLGLLKPSLFTRLLYAVERFTYRHARTVSGITKGMLQLFSRKGVPPARQYLLSNWILPPARVEAGAGSPAGTFRGQIGISPGDLLVVYSGNLGRKQGLNNLLDAVEELVRTRRNDGIAIVLAGEGAARTELNERIDRQNLPVRLLPIQPEANYQAMLRDADLCLVTQQKGAGTLFFPSKLIALLAAGCAVLTVADEESELAGAVREGKFGRNVPPENPQALAAALAAFTRQRDQLPQMGAAGRQWIQRFSREPVLAKFSGYLTAQLNQEKEPATSLAHE